MSSDEIMQGFVISLFALCGISSAVYCFRMYLKDRPTLKQSPSMEDLTSISTEDPQV
jgi:hypothetical protein